MPHRLSCPHGTIRMTNTSLQTKVTLTFGNLPARLGSHVAGRPGLTRPAMSQASAARFVDRLHLDCVPSMSLLIVCAHAFGLGSLHNSLF